MAHQTNEAQQPRQPECPVCHTRFLAQVIESALRDKYFPPKKRDGVDKAALMALARRKGHPLWVPLKHNAPTCQARFGCQLTADGQYVCSVSDQVRLLPEETQPY